MGRWRCYPLVPVDARDATVRDADGQPDFDAPTAQKLLLRWRAPGERNPRRRRFANTKGGLAEARRLETLLTAGAQHCWPADPDGLPQSTSAATSPRAGGADRHDAPAANAAEPAGEGDGARSPQGHTGEGGPVDGGRLVALPPQPPPPRSAAEAARWTVAQLGSYYLATVLPATPKAPTRAQLDTSVRFAVRLLVYGPDDPRGAEGESMRVGDVTTPDGQYAVERRRATNLRAYINGPTPRQDGAKVGLASERHFYNDLRRVFAFAHRMTPPLIDANPMDEVVARHHRRGKQMRSTEDERQAAERARGRETGTVEDVLWVLDNHLDAFWEPHVLNVIATPKRVGELAALAVDDFDLDERVVAIDRTATPVSARLNNGQTWQHGAPKWREYGDRSVVPLPQWPRLLDCLARWLPQAQQLHDRRVAWLREELELAARLGDQQRHEQVAAWLGEQQRFVRAFPSKQGAPFRGSNFNERVWHPAVAAAFPDKPGEPRHPLRGRAFGELRHIVTNDSIDNAGLNYGQVADLAGNSEKTILEHYRHGTSDADAQARAALDRRWQDHGDEDADDAAPAPDAGNVIDFAAARARRRKGVGDVG
ncbi:hypothetical protein ER308_08860 [Egibacter rhizosphaerae]|uniref:Uncharacterized protein n=1 Tax=Egibacter rhizosphaerae TaxID=1670831 RepID=A0A411YEM9_9ACTN|nr:hypothetical protein [Egibacter rhizosphaerae]QBI19651.1 hypothetical protein ER308_08860 [Egibacter rhizosphaerae]